ncbi:hypothetical protein KXW53_009640, partial [Aspergillus fumigatus]
NLTLHPFATVNNQEPQKITFHMAPKRVILRLSVREFGDWSEPLLFEVVQSLFRYLGRPVEELGDERHYYRAEPLQQQTSKPQTRFHVIVDLNKDQFKGPIDNSVEHEIYRVHRKDSIAISPYKNVEERENLIRRTRYYTDQ